MTTKLIVQSSVITLNIVANLLQNCERKIVLAVKGNWDHKRHIYRQGAGEIEVVGELKQQL